MTSDERNVQRTIDEIVRGHRVVLFMKGTKSFPQCGFSKAVVDVLKALGVDFFDVDVLKDPDIRQGVKEYSNWPTLPQLYIDGKFVGGCDITLELYRSGELQRLLGLEAAS